MMPWDSDLDRMEGRNGNGRAFTGGDSVKALTLCRAETQSTVIVVYRVYKEVV